MAQGDLDIVLLYRMMMRLGELRDRPPLNPSSEGDLMPLAKTESLQGIAALNHIQRHANYLKDIGLLNISQAVSHIGF